MLQFNTPDPKHEIPEWYWRKKLRKYMTDNMRIVIIAENRLKYPMPRELIDDYGPNETIFWKHFHGYGITLDGFRLAIVKRIERNIHPELHDLWIKVWNIIVKWQQNQYMIHNETIDQERTIINTLI